MTHLNTGKPIEAGKDYTVAGWGQRCGKRRGASWHGRFWTSRCAIEECKYRAEFQRQGCRGLAGRLIRLRPCPGQRRSFIVLGVGRLEIFSGGKMPGMSKLNLSVAIGDYDRNRPLISGAVRSMGSIRCSCYSVAGGDFLSCVANLRLRYPRTVAIELYGENIRRQQPLCRNPVLSSRVSPHLDLRADRPHQEARRPQGQASRRAGVSTDRECVGARDPARTITA